MKICTGEEFEHDEIIFDAGYNGDYPCPFCRLIEKCKEEIQGYIKKQEEHICPTSKDYLIRIDTYEVQLIEANRKIRRLEFSLEQATKTITWLHEERKTYD